MSENRVSPVPTGSEQKAENDLVLSFLALRRAIGLLGFFLPVALISYSLLSGTTVLPSMSAYYYSPMREIFVGTLCAQAVFLWSYEGYRDPDGGLLTDRNVSRVASLGVLGVALVPTAQTLVDAPLVEDATEVVGCTISHCLLGYEVATVIHFVAAGMFFGALAVFCLILFVKGEDQRLEKRASNRIYRICGWTIVISLLLIAAVQIPTLRIALASWRPVLWLEVVATFAFATSWAVKGDAMRPLVRATAQVM